MQIEGVYLSKSKVDVEDTLIRTKPDSITVDSSWKIHSNPVTWNTDIEGGRGGGGCVESFRINGVSVLSGLNLEKNVKGFLSPGTKQTVRNNEVSV